MRCTRRREISCAVRYALTSVDCVVWMAAGVQLRIISIQVHVLKVKGQGHVTKPINAETECVAYTNFKLGRRYGACAINCNGQLYEGLCRTGYRVCRTQRPYNCIGIGLTIL